MEERHATCGSSDGQDGAPSPSLLRQARELPNLLTFARLAAVPLLVWAHVSERPLLALVLFVSAALSDGLDGLLARLLDKRTRLGELLDPAADKLLTLTALITLVLRGLLPGWLLAVVLVRDGGIVLLALLLRARQRRVPAAPTRLGKYATFLLFLVLSLGFASQLGPGAGLRPAIAVLSVLAAECVLGASMQYFLRWRLLMQKPPSSPPSSRPLPKNDSPAPPPRSLSSWPPSPTPLRERRAGVPTSEQ